MKSFMIPNFDLLSVFNDTKCLKAHSFKYNERSPLYNVIRKDM